MTEYDCGEFWYTKNLRDKKIYVIMGRYGNHVFYIRQHKTTYRNAKRSTIKNRIRHHLIRLSVTHFEKNNNWSQRRNLLSKRIKDTYSGLIIELMHDVNFLGQLAKATKI